MREGWRTTFNKKETYMELLVQLLIVVLIFGVIQWFIQSVLKIAEPAKTVSLVILAVIFVLVLLHGYHSGHFLYYK